MVVSLYFGGKRHVSNGQTVSFKEPCVCFLVLQFLLSWLGGGHRPRLSSGGARIPDSELIWGRLKRFWLEAGFEKALGKV